MFKKKFLLHQVAALAVAAFGGMASANTILPTSDVQLFVNVATGDVRLTTTVAGGLAIGSFEIDSASGSLMPANQNVLPGFTTLGTTANDVAQGDLSGSYTLDPSFDLGNIFSLTGTHDLALSWLDAASNYYSGAPVNYTAVPEASTLALMGAAAMGILLLGRRRRVP